MLSVDAREFGEIWGSHGDEYEYHHPDDGGSTLPWNVGQYLPHYTKQNPGGQSSSSSTIFYSGNLPTNVPMYRTLY
jgi:hypothetical protein